MHYIPALCIVGIYILQATDVESVALAEHDHTMLPV